jgi:hypothetical protein
MKQFFIKMLSSTDNGDVSSKRVITFSAFVLVSIAFISNIFFELPLKEFVYDGMLYLVAAGLGFTALERFAKK